MHSSRMRTGRSLTVYWSLLPGGGGGGVCSGGGIWSWGGVCSGGVWSWGVSAPRGVSLPGGSPCQGGLLAGGGSRCWRPPPPWTESQTPVKTLPWPNFVAAGNDSRHEACLHRVSVRVPTRTGKPGKPGKMGRHFPVREKSGNFEQTGKVREKSGKITQNTGKLREFQTNIIFYFLVIFKLTVYYFAEMHQIFSYKINF